MEGAISVPMARKIIRREESGIGSWMIMNVITGMIYAMFTARA